MTNPVATIGNSIPTPSDPSVIRKTYSQILFQEEIFLTYADGEFDPSYTTYDPTNQGKRFFIFVPLDDVLGANKPQFVSQSSWDETVKKAASGFITGRYSIMPKLFIPSLELVDNGVVTDGVGGTRPYAAYVDPATNVEAFNWTALTVNAVAINEKEIVKYIQSAGLFGSQYISVRAKDDAVNTTTFAMDIDPPPQVGGVAPTSGTEGWSTSHELVVDGAFVLMLNIIPSRPGKVSQSDVQENSWSIRFEFQDVIMELNSTGGMKVGYTSGTDRQNNETTVNLSEGKTKEGPPQQEHIEGKQPYIIVVYPVWNGIIVMSGNQESREVVNVSSTFVPMKKDRSVLVAPYSTGFDPTAPAPVEVGIGTGSTNVIPNFGTTMTVTATNVRFDLSYQPCFFSRSMWFDEWFVASDDVPGTVDYTYNIYPIWTANGTAATLGSLAPIQSSFAGAAADTSYWYAKWRMEMTKHDRYAGEILGEIFEIQEQRDFPIRNGNGNFNLNWTGGTPGDPAPTGDWRDYVQSISVTISLDGSSGSLTVDKYGLAGQEAEAIQDIGAITIDMTGGFGTVAGTIFEGIGFGIIDGITSEGATWEVPLVGLEKKMEDIALINVPFLDGETATDAIRFLTKYAGLNVDFSGAPGAAFDRLSVSEDINVARFDWKSGTSVKSAMDDVMDDLQYNYVVMDGEVKIYALDADGLPSSPGPNREVGYSGTNIITVDQSPDFENLRNEIVVIGLEQVPEGTGTNIADIPLFPIFERRSSSTTPSVPWAKSMVKPLPGTLTPAEVSDQADKLEAISKHYEVLGRTTIAGNANIKPYDQWGDFIIYSVTHNIDLISKTWTTDLEFSKA